MNVICNILINTISSFFIYSFLKKLFLLPSLLLNLFECYNAKERKSNKYVFRICLRKFL